LRLLARKSACQALGRPALPAANVPVGLAAEGTWRPTDQAVVEVRPATYHASMSAARLIVCERTSRWAAALARALPNPSKLVVSVRSLVQCQAALESAPASLAAVEIAPADLASTIEFFARTARFPKAQLAALVPAELAAAELLLREAGAVDVLTTLAQAPRLARLFVRHQRRAPATDRSFQELVAERLPWPALAAASA